THRERRAFLSGPEHDPRALGDLADRGAPSVFLEPIGSAWISVAAALPSAALPEPLPGAALAWIDVLFLGRALCRRPLPGLPIRIVARVGLADEADIEGFRDLSPAGIERVIERVHAGAQTLA